MKARAALAYVAGPSPVHAGSPAAAAAFLGSFSIVAFVFDSPLVLIAASVIVAAIGYAAGASRAVNATLRFGLAIVVLMVAVNALVVHRGATVLVRGWELPVLGRVDVTLESLAAGAVIGLRVLLVMLAFSIYSACVDPDRVLRALRPLARRSALTAILIARLIPVAVADLARLQTGAELRGPGAAPAGRGAVARRLVAGALERSVDLAATLELRGHSLPPPPRERRRDRVGSRSRHDSPLITAGAMIALVAVVGRISGIGEFEAFPTLAIDAGSIELALIGVVGLLAVGPFGFEGARRVLRARSARV